MARKLPTKRVQKGQNAGKPSESVAVLLQRIARHHHGEEFDLDAATAAKQDVLVPKMADFDWCNLAYRGEKSAASSAAAAAGSAAGSAEPVAMEVDVEGAEPSTVEKVLSEGGAARAADGEPAGSCGLRRSKRRRGGP